MSFYQVFDFLRDLQDNNRKEWMNEHRDRYENAKAFIIKWADALTDTLTEVDDAFEKPDLRNAISRINNNLLYHPNKPTYKDHFGVELLLSSGPSGFYVHIGLKDSFIGGGIHNPSSDTLKKIRAAIDHNGKALKAIVEEKKFQAMFGGLSQEKKLKTSPKEYDTSHKHIEFLRLKSFTAGVSTTQKEIASDDFQKRVVEVYKQLVPFGKFLNEALA
ncbi:MAG: DUF2461 domain-containing protein [Thermonemataceae bacterium]